MATPLEPRPPTFTPYPAEAGRGHTLGPEVYPTHFYEDLGAEIGALVQQKQAAYGDAFGRSGVVMRQLYPDGIRPEQFDDALGVVRVLDKLFRIATDRDALGESPWRDIAGYGLLGAARVERGRQACPPAPKGGP